MEFIMQYKIRIINFIVLFILLCSKTIHINAQSVNIQLNQGTLSGIKVFPDGSLIPVYTYLGIPYASPPIGNLRFRPPKPHSGWNLTYNARSYMPICPQTSHNIYEEVINQDENSIHRENTNENCLYLNIWTPQTALSFGKQPVLVMVFGEEMSFDWNLNRPTGLNLASEGIVVVTVQYRTNIFGWLTLDVEESPGNLGLRDQQLALKWVQENIEKFGGDPNQVTLLGHGTSGASLVMIHLTSPRSEGLFSQAIIMSGTIFSSYSFRPKQNSVILSNQLVRELACQSMTKTFALDCLQTKSVDELLRAHQRLQKDGLYEYILGPHIDNSLHINERIIPIDPRIKIRNSKIPNILIGFNNNEGAFIQKKWLELAKNGYIVLKDYIINEILPNILNHYEFKNPSSEDVFNTIYWQFFEQGPKTTAYLLNVLQRLITETRFDVPMLRTFDILSQNSNNFSTSNRTNGNNNSTNEFNTSNNGLLYVYSFQQSKSIDMRGTMNYFGGASHSTDLPFLLGPTLFQQISRKRFSNSEYKLCQQMHKYFIDFIRTGSPTPGRLFDGWQPYNGNSRYMRILSSSEHLNALEYEENLEQINLLLNPTNYSLINPYQTGNIPTEILDNRSSQSYFPSNGSSLYHSKLNKIYTFWNILLPKLEAKTNYNKTINVAYGSDNRIPDSDQMNAKFKHAFFVLLALITLLLILLALCVYLMRKEKGLKSSLL